MLGLDDLGVDPRPGQGGERRMMIPAVVAQGVTLGHHPRHQSRVLGDLLPDLAEGGLDGGGREHLEDPRAVARCP